MPFGKIREVSRITFWIANVAGTILLSLIFVCLLTGVVFRYVLQHPLPWPEETCTIVVVWMAFFGASIGLKERSHTAIMGFLSLLPSGLRNTISIAVDGLVGIFAGYLIVFGWNLAVLAGTGQRTVFWGIPYFYVYLSVSVGGLLLLVQALALIYDGAQELLSREKKKGSLASKLK
jgi:TRAP-type C4-dicarboxylate transport system permease small subunit